MIIQNSTGGNHLIRNVILFLIIPKLRTRHNSIFISGLLQCSMCITLIGLVALVVQHWKIQILFFLMLKCFLGENPKLWKLVWVLCNSSNPNKNCFIILFANFTKPNTFPPLLSIFNLTFLYKRIYPVSLSLSSTLEMMDGEEIQELLNECGTDFG
jgi:hypothetical protein